MDTDGLIVEVSFKDFSLFLFTGFLVGLRTEDGKIYKPKNLNRLEDITSKNIKKYLGDEVKSTLEFDIEEEEDPEAEPKEIAIYTPNDKEELLDILDFLIQERG